MNHLLMNGPHHTVAALDVLAVLLIPVILWSAWRFVRQYRASRAAVEGYREIQVKPARGEQDAL